MMIEHNLRLRKDQHEAVAPAFATVLGGLFSCIAQRIQVNIQLNQNYQVTHFHSDYPYTPAQLPSNTVQIQLANLNADEQRNLVFQLEVPKLNDENEVEMASSQQPMSQEAAADEHASADNSTIGKLSSNERDVSLILFVHRPCVSHLPRSRCQSLGLDDSCSIPIGSISTTVCRFAPSPSYARSSTQSCRDGSCPRTSDGRN